MICLLHHEIVIHLNIRKFSVYHRLYLKRFVIAEDRVQYHLRLTHFNCGFIDGYAVIEHSQLQLQVLRFGDIAKLKPFLGDLQHVAGIKEVALADFIVHLCEQEVVIGVHYIYCDRLHGFHVVSLAFFIGLGLYLLVPFELVVCKQRLIVINVYRS